MADQTFAVNSGFYDAVNSDRTYSADDMNRPYKRLVSNGVFATPQGTKSTDLQVVAAGGMQIIVKAGEGIFADKWFENPAAINITVPSNTSTSPRIDSVIVQVDKRTSGRVGNIVYRTGTPSSNPSAPAINTTSDVIEYRLANIRVAASAVSITGGVITDRRGSSDCPWITSLIYQVDTSTLYDQWEAAYAEYFEAEKAMWDDWYSHLTEELDVSMTLVKRTNTVITTSDTSDIEIGIPDFNTNTDLLEVYINGLKAIEGVQYTVNDNTSISLTAPVNAGQVVSFVIFKSVIMGNDVDIMSLINALEERISSIQGGNPTVVSSTSDMTDTDKIYVLSTDSKWYYYSLSSSEWVIGGTYGGVPTDTTLTQAGMAADAKKTGDEITAIKADLDERLDRYNLFFYPINSFTQKITENTIIDENGSEVANTNNHTTDFIKYRPGSTLIIKNGSTPANITYLAYYDRKLQFISRSSMYPSTGTGIILPDDTEYIRVCYKTTLTNLSVFMDYVVNSYPAIPIPETRNPNAFCPSDYGYEADTDISDWCNYIISVYPNPTILIDTSYYIDKTVTLADGVSFKGTSRKSLIRRRENVIMFKAFGSPYNSEKTITVDGESVQTYAEGTRRFITFSDIQIHSDSNDTLFTNPIFDLKGVTLSNFVRMTISCNGKHFRCAQLQDSSFVDCHFFNSGDITSSANVTSYPSFDLKMFVYKSYPADTVIDETTYPEGYAEYFLPVNQLTFDRCTWESYRGECFITDGYSNDISFTGCKFESVPHVGSIIYAASQQESEKATGILSNWKFDNCVITAHAVVQKPLLDLRGAYNCTFGIKFAVENNYTYPFISFSSIYAIGNTFSIKIRFKSSDLSLGAYIVDIGNKTNLHRALLLAKNNFAVKRFYLPGGPFKTTIVAPVTSNIPDSALWSVGDYVPDITNLTNGWVCTSVNPAVFEVK